MNTTKILSHESEGVFVHPIADPLIKFPIVTADNKDSITEKIVPYKTSSFIGYI
jgi:hypothetical protein